MGLRKRIADGLGYADDVAQANGDIGELMAMYDHGNDPGARGLVATKIASLLRGQAANLDASRFARAMSYLPKPAELRAEAADWAARAIAAEAERA